MSFKELFEGKLKVGDICTVKGEGDKEWVITGFILGGRRITLKSVEPKFKKQYDFISTDADNVTKV